MRPISRDLAALASVIAAWWALSAWLPTFWQVWKGSLLGAITKSGAETLGAADAITAIGGLKDWMLGLLPVLAAITSASLLAWIGQGALRFRSRADVDRVHVESTAGLATLWSGAKLVVIAAAFASLTHHALRAVASTPTADLAYSLRVLSAIVDALASRLGIVLGLMVIADLIVQRLLWRRSLRMTREELKRELRETEGDPVLRAERSGRQRQTALEP